MERLVRTVRRHVRRARGVERFVRLIVGGGIALLAGLWIATLSEPGSPLWLSGSILALVGVGGLTAGIWCEIEY